VQTLTNTRAQPIGADERAGHDVAEHDDAGGERAAIDPIPLMASTGFERATAAAALKRVVDMIVAAALLILTAPLSLLVALLIKLEDGGPVLFRQARVGRNGVVFTLRKFRSMQVDAEADTGPVWAQADDPRTTRLGRWMRPLGVDEIPQVWNVLRGEMSFIGPRPERPEFVTTLAAAIPFYMQRHAVRPGITGWAQINCPSGSTVDDARQKLEHDLYYLEHFSLRMDLAIALRTIQQTLSGSRNR
jgi:exopolysaccharide biosynthesis polyprenyl glycosylphosphotransferase